MKLDAINIVLIVLAVGLGITYMSLRNARKHREKRASRRLS